MRSSPRNPVAALFALAVLLGVAACEKPRAFGDANSVVVAADPGLWEEVQDTILSVLEPRIFTVRRERSFRLTFQDPADEAWTRLQNFRQELLIGSRQDPWVARALEERSSDEPLSPPQILQVRDVWARNQLVTVMLLPEGGGAEAVHPLIDPLQRLMDQQFREYARARMYVSGRDTALTDTLMREHGFQIEIPNVYRWARETDSIFVFRNDNPDPSELIRQVTVAWRSPLPEEMPPHETLLEWRQELAQEHYSYPQVHDTTLFLRQDTTFRGMEMREVQAVWSNPPEDQFPAGGPFIFRAIACPEDDRLYLVDAWLYAPGEDKYEYMIQLETIMESFRCRPEGGGSGG